jgi:hypothetical protein
LQNLLDSCFGNVQDFEHFSSVENLIDDYSEARRHVASPRYILKNFEYTFWDFQKFAHTALIITVTEGSWLNRESTNPMRSK